jgi:protein-disulfide isomerase
MLTTKLKRVLAAGTLAAGLALAIAPGSQVAAQSANANWNTTFATTEGGHKVGNPQAQTSLIAFVSYSCPHCADFEKQSDAPLRAGYIQSGKLSLEVRHVIRNPIDLAAALATECGDKARFFERHRAVMLSHEKWMEKARSATPAQQQRWSTGDLPGRMRAIAGDLGFYELLEPRGLSRAQLDRCLSDEARANSIAQASQAQGQRFGIQGTPSFAINGRLLEGVHNWAQLQQALDESA